MTGMSPSDAWLNHVAGRLRAESFDPLPPHGYQPAGFKFALRVRDSRLRSLGCRRRSSCLPT